MKRITGHLTEKNGKWYAVVNLYNMEGKRKEKWHNLDLESKQGKKTEAKFRLGELLSKYNSGDLYLFDTLPKAEQERILIASQPFEYYISEWLEDYKVNISPLTYSSYKTMVNSNIIPYFKAHSLHLNDITGDEINAFYLHLRSSGLSGATAQRFHSLLHLAFKHAVKRRIISSNPCDQADRPKAIPYIGSYYNADELKALIDLTENDPLHIPIILASYYGLRRSEVLGLKWSAVDWCDNKIYIRHKIIENQNGQSKRIEGYDVMKNKSSYRVLPLIPYVKEVLLAEKEKQEKMQKLSGRSYNKGYLDYVCVSPSGNIITPGYISRHFKLILEKNNIKVIRFHDLRHSCASLLLSNKVPMKMIQDWLGHSDMSTTANIYSHIDYTSKIESADIIGNILSN